MMKIMEKLLCVIYPMHIINPDKIQCMFKSKFDNLEQKETLFDFQGFFQGFSFSFFFFCCKL